jgi:hypothetical protein
MTIAPAPGRLPDFVIIGAMKSGTSSLYQWLARQPELALPAVKEPHFFSRDEVWERGLGWYCGLFPDAPGKLLGEASTTYTNPDHCLAAASRLAKLVPEARLIYLLRHPVERMRSHYRHAVLRGEERRSLDDVLHDPGNRYLRRSLYYRCVAPYLDAFDRSQICVVRFDDLVTDEAPAWAAVLDHLGLPPRTRPTDAYNVSAEKSHYTALMNRVWNSPLRARVAQVPAPLRRCLRGLMVRDGPAYDARLEASEVPIPDEVVVPLWQDLERLEQWLGREEPLWPNPIRASNHH